MLNAEILAELCCWMDDEECVRNFDKYKRLRQVITKNLESEQARMFFQTRDEVREKYRRGILW